jgi:hypothetical protein
MRRSANSMLMSFFDHFCKKPLPPPLHLPNTLRAPRTLTSLPTPPPHLPPCPPPPRGGFGRGRASVRGALAAARTCLGPCSPAATTSRMRPRPCSCFCSCGGGRSSLRRSSSPSPPAARRGEQGGVPRLLPLTADPAVAVPSAASRRRRS